MSAADTATDLSPVPSGPDPAPPRGARVDPSGPGRGRRLRSWALHGLVVAGVVGAVALDRRLRRRRPGVSPAVGTLAVAGLYQAVIRSAEERYPHDETWGVQRDELRTDAAISTLTVITATVAKSAARALVAGVAPHGKDANLARRSTATGAVVALLGYDLMHSRLHHLSHEWGPLWRLHAVHHSSTRLNTTNGARFQFLEIALDSFIEGVMLEGLGLSREQHIAYDAVRFTYGQLQHANIDLDSGALDRVFSTPDLHRWHHSTVYDEGDTNFGAVLSVWDTVFGTFYNPADRECPEEIGIGRMPDFPTDFGELQRVPLDWVEIRERNAATWYAEEPEVPADA